jgi:hypothetical protein
VLGNDCGVNHGTWGDDKIDDGTVGSQRQHIARWRRRPGQAHWLGEAHHDVVADLIQLERLSAADINDYASIARVVSGPHRGNAGLAAERGVCQPR